MDADGRLLRLEAVDTTTLQSRVYQLLRNTLFDGQFRPGEVFTIRALAGSMGTSVMPVREALARLDAEGAVEIRTTSRQIRIPIMPRESVAELYRVRTELEGMVSAMAAERITPAELSSVEGFIGTMKDAVVAGDERGFLRANRAFHFEIYRAAKSYHLMAIIETLWLKFGPLLRVPLGPGSQAQNRVMDGDQHLHREALKALSVHDADAARRAIQADLAETAAWFARHYDPASYVSIPHKSDGES